MSTGHTHTDAHGCEATHRLLCELFDADTPPARREEIRKDLAACPECLAVAQSERDVRAIVRECCGPAKAPEPLRQRIVASLTTVTYTEVHYR
ncbi:hypothetical protein [Corynebacterium fournieri]|uniref:hypothetical protein n=1 Tax=Corynebacterium fournieri TaxID=1852390 RepID=UPI000A2F519F|nr:hypothetical protein [Corynebacterium fournieri]WJY96964.1 hypothetical protein CFOUR_02630 [Corynebacterium fournieri]